MTYEIRNLDDLENSVSDLLRVNENIRKNADSMQYIIKQVKINWENEAGQDLASILQELEECANKIEGAIIPTVDKYVSVMNTLVQESRSTQSNTL
ncbi:MAG TPA: hypothetical protein DCY94_04390 [Firmicutes bacterium]|nr:hypothetical protein [Bacillota bacterium]